MLYRDTLVGFFDITGYSAYVKTTKIEEGIDRVKSLFQGTRSWSDTDILAVKLEHWILSDSIILVVDTNRHRLFKGSIEVFLGTCSTFLLEGIEKGFPLRGAVGGGDFFKDGEIMYSSALVDAAEYEEKQDWFGAVITPNALSLIEKSKELDRAGGIKEINLHELIHDVGFGKIPWKNGKELSTELPEETYYIKPFDFNDPNWEAKLPSFIDKKKAEK